MSVIDCVREFNSWVIPALRMVVQHRPCSVSHCRSALISNNTLVRVPGGEGDSMSNLALRKDCPPLCSLMAISDVRNIQMQSAEVTTRTVLPSAS